MGAIVAPAPDLTRLQTMKARPAKALMPLHPADDPALSAAVDSDILTLIATAIRRSGCKQDALAAMSVVKAPQLSAALNGRGGFNVRWLDAWPQAFWTVFIDALRAAHEDSDTARQLQKKERLIRAIEAVLDVAS